MDLERVTDDNALDWETEPEQHRARRRARLQVLVDTLQSSGPESVFHQMKVMVPVLLTLEDVVLYLQALQFPEDAPEAQAARDSQLADVRSRRRDVAERVHELQVAHQFGWSTLKEYQKRTGTGCNKELLAAAEAVKSHSEKSGIRRRDKSGPEPYKKGGGRGFKAAPGQFSSASFGGGYGSGTMYPVVHNMSYSPYPPPPPPAWANPAMSSPQTGPAYSGGYHQYYGRGYGTGSRESSGGFRGGERRLELCYKCGEPGHHAPHCPQQRKILTSELTSGEGTKPTARQVGTFSSPEVKEREESDVPGLQEHEAMMGDDGKVSGRIHKPEYFAFWRDVLLADSWVLEVIQEGYRLPWISRPGPYFEGNNKSAKEESVFVWEKMLQWEKAEFVQRVVEQPICVSPLTVAKHNLPDGKIKKRLCFDGSRWINKFLKKEKLSLMTVSKTMELIERDDFQACIDLESAYYHIQIHPDDVDFLGIQVEDPATRRAVFFRYRVLAFGLSTAAHALTRVTKPVIRYLHKQGIKYTMYIDDGRVSASTRQAAQTELETVKNTFCQAGFVLSREKSDGGHQVAQRKAYLGFEVDSRSMSVFVSTARIAKVQDSINELLKMGKPSAKQVAKVVGQINSLELATGPVVHLYCRQAHRALEATEQQGWSCNLELSQACRRDLAELCRHLPGLNGYPVRTIHTAVALRTIFGEDDSFTVGRAIPAHHTHSSSKVVAGDASDSAVCAYTIKSQESFYFRSALAAHERTLSSGHRELLTVARTLQACGNKLRVSGQGVTIYWVTDSSNLVAFLTKGSPKEPIQKDAIATYRLAKQLNIHLVPIHTSREDPRIRIADAGSKKLDSEDWGIDVFSFQSLQQRFGPFSVDLFAAVGNNKVDRFYTPFAMPGTEGIDAFAHSWERENAFLTPPIRLIIAAWKKMISTTMRGCLVVPNWPAHPFWPVLFSTKQEGPLGLKIRVEEFRPFIVSGKECASVVMTGHTEFSWLAVIVDNTGK